MKMSKRLVIVEGATSARMRPVIGCYKDEQMHCQDIKEEGRAHLFATKRRLGNDVNNLLHRAHFARERTIGD